MNIILAGMPGCGKTTVSTQIAAISGRELADTDELIVRKYGKISDIFEKFGDEYFRQLETKAVKEAAEIQNAVIATGGGCLMRDENVAIFKRSGKIIYLKTGLDTLYNRLQGDDTRPLLKGDMKERLKNLYMERSERYEKVADFTVTTDGATPREIAKQILELI